MLFIMLALFTVCSSSSNNDGDNGGGINVSSYYPVDVSPTALHESINIQFNRVSGIGAEGTDACLPYYNLKRGKETALGNLFVDAIKWYGTEMADIEADFAWLIGDMMSQGIQANQTILPSKILSPHWQHTACSRGLPDKSFSSTIISTFSHLKSYSSVYFAQNSFKSAPFGGLSLLIGLILTAFFVGM